MRILIATPLYPPEIGGPATYSKLLEEMLPMHGFEVSVLTFKKVRHLPPGLRHVAYFWKCYWLARRADIVFAQDTVSVGFPAVFAAALAGKKFLVRVPGDHAWEQARQRFGVTDALDVFQTKKYGWRVEMLRSMARFVVRHAHKVVVPSEYMLGIVAGWLAPLDSTRGKHDKKIVVIYSSVDTIMPYELPNDRPEGFLVVSSGRNVPWKGFDALQRVVSQEKGWHLFIAEGLPRAKALGWVKSADVFVLNSTYEGLSHALVEAMFLGTTVVATLVGGNPELIENGKDGLLVPSGDDAALHAAIKQVETDTTAARVRADNAKHKVKDFSSDTTIAKITQVLNSI